MSINCDPEELANAARCFEQKIASGLHPSIQTWLLCQIANQTPTPASNYKSWVGLISQAGVNAPTTDALLENTLGAGVWSRNADGDYQLDFPAGTLPVLKTTVLVGTAKDADHYVIARNNGSDGIGVITVDTTTAPFTPAVDSLVKTTLEIRVYP